MGFCQYAIIILYAMSLGIALSEHGEPRTGTHNFVISLISVAIELSLLYFGGFFK